MATVAQTNPTMSEASLVEESTTARPPASSERIPPLRNGDRLTAAEFDRRYEAMPGVKAELIEGVVYVASPVSAEHGYSHFDLNGWLFVYKAMTPGVAGASDATVRLDLDNRPQPDLHLSILESHGGRVRISEDGYVVGAPELVVEIAVSTASYDLHDKLNAYRRNAVLEYLVWRVQDGQIDWFLFEEGRYVRLGPSPDGLLKSVVFPGLWLDPSAAIRGDSATVLRLLQDGIASPEHAAFVARLNETAEKLAAPQPTEAAKP